MLQELGLKGAWGRPLLVAAVLVTLAFTAGGVRAQGDAPPADGGLTYSLGMPPVYKGRAGFEVGWYRPQSTSAATSFFNLGVGKSLGSPVVGIAGLRLEGYLGLTEKDFDGGGRALFEIPSFHVGFGVDYNGLDEVADFLFALDLPMQRGGLFGRGTTLAVRWLPSRDQTFSVGVNVPLWGRNIGATRPKRDHVRLIKRKPERLELDVARSELATLLDDLSDRVFWVARLTQPFAERSGADPHAAVAPDLEELTAHLATTGADFPDGHTLPAEIRAYHATLDRAFTVAAGGTDALGAEISVRARDELLEHVLIPYNRLLGQRKTDDSLIGQIAVAQNRFAGWVLADLDLSDENARRVFYVFQTDLLLGTTIQAELECGFSPPCEPWIDGLATVAEITLIVEGQTVPVAPTTWGEIRALYR